MKKVFIIKEVVGERYLERAKDSEDKTLKYIFYYKSVGESIETFSTVEEAHQAYAEYLEHHGFTPFIIQAIFVEE